MHARQISSTDTALFVPGSLTGPASGQGGMYGQDEVILVFAVIRPIILKRGYVSENSFSHSKNITFFETTVKLKNYLEPYFLKTGYIRFCRQTSCSSSKGHPTSLHQKIIYWKKKTKKNQPNEKIFSL